MLALIALLVVLGLVLGFSVSHFWFLLCLAILLYFVVAHDGPRRW